MGLKNQKQFKKALLNLSFIFLDINTFKKKPNKVNLNKLEETLMEDDYEEDTLDDEEEEEEKPSEDEDQSS